MPSRRMLMAVAVLTFALPLAACSNSVRLSSAKMCTAAGGSYVANLCNPGAPNQKTGSEMCQAHGGMYDPALDLCEIPGSSK